MVISLISLISLFGYTRSKVIDIFLSHWKCIKGTPKLGFWRFRGENLKFYLSKPQEACPYPEPRLLVYFMWKSVQRAVRTVHEFRKRKQGKAYLGYVLHLYVGKTPSADFTKMDLL